MNLNPNAIPANIAKCMPAAVRKSLHAETVEELAGAAEVRDEREMQQICEAWLRQRGYWPRSDAYLTGKRPEAGWYVHLHEAKRNPILLDLLIWTHSGACIEIELKTKTGKLRHNQQVIIGHGGSTRCCRSVEAFMLAVREWEAGYATGGSRTA